MQSAPGTITAIGRSWICARCCSMVEMMEVGKEAVRSLTADTVEEVRSRSVWMRPSTVVVRADMRVKRKTRQPAKAISATNSANAHDLTA